MIKLDIDDQHALYSIASNSAPEDVQRVLEGIASKHGCDWASFPTWDLSKSGHMTPISWSGAEPDKQLHPQLVELAFRHWWPKLSTQDEIRQLFSSFADSLGSLALADNGPTDDGGLARNQARDSIAAMLVAAGSDGMAFAVAALSFATHGRLEEWIAYGWSKARAFCERAALGGKGGARVIDSGGVAKSRRRRDDGSGLG